MSKYMYEQTLYAKNSSGDVVQWTIQTKDEGGIGVIDLFYGRMGQSLTHKSLRITEGKNIGKANETTAIEQAINEATSKYNKKIKEGYRETIKELSEFRQDASGDDKPMLAKKFEHNKFKYPALIQPKLNGVRAELGTRIKKDGLFGEYVEVYLKSRDGNDYPVPKHIKDAYLAILVAEPKLKGVKLDGEIYCHDMMLQEIVSAIKKPNHNTSQLQFICYDVKTNDPQYKRIEFTNLIPRVANYITSLETYVVHNDEQAEENADDFISQGYEGAIIRNTHAPYQFGKRSKHLQKIKRHIDKEFLLVDIIESGYDKYQGHSIGMFVCKNDVTDATFKVTPEASKKERFQYLEAKDKFIGKFITVRFRERTKDKIPFHANGIIRDYE